MIKDEESKLLKLNEKIEVLDSKTEYKLLRPNLTIPALRILSENKDNEYPQKIFEIGTVFSKDEKEESGIKESTNLVVSITPGNFTEIKQILDYLAKMLSTNFTLKESIKKDLIEGRTGEIFLNNKPIGYIGEVHPETLKGWNIKLPVSLFELRLDEIINRVQ